MRSPVRGLRPGRAGGADSIRRAHEEDALVIGVSTSARFNETLGAPDGARAVHFAGRIEALDGRAEIVFPATAIE